MELSGTRDLVELLRAHPERTRRGEGQLGHTAPAGVNVGPALGQGAQEHVTRLAAGGHAPSALAGVHATVGKLKRLPGVVRLLGQEHGPVRRAHVETVAVRRQGLHACRHQRLDARRAQANQCAELVTPEAVGPPVSVDRVRELGAEPGQQAVAGKVPEGVVVLLESVQIEQEQRTRLVR